MASQAEIRLITLNQLGVTGRVKYSELPRIEVHPGDKIRFSDKLLLTASAPSLKEINPGEHYIKTETPTGTVIWLNVLYHLVISNPSLKIMTPVSP